MFLTVLSLLVLPAQADFTNIRVNSDEEPALPFHNEEQIVVNPTDSLNLVACWRDFRLGYRQIGIGVSFDGGLTWEDRLLDNSGFPYDSDPGLTTDADGNIYLVSLSFQGGGGENALAVFKSTDGGLTFGEPSYSVYSNGQTFEDKELIACDRTNSDYGGNLYVVWTRFDYVEETSRITGVASHDGGESWINPVNISDDVGVQWPVPCVGADGTLYAAWVDYDPASIVIDRSLDGGLTWGTDRMITYVLGFGYVDDWIGVFSFPAMDADITNGIHSGNLYIAYMDVGANGTADIFFVRSEDGGDTWSQPQLISGNDAPNNDQFHPWLVVDNLGIIHVVFYDQRNGLAEDLQDLYYTRSVDGGDTWFGPVRVSTVASRPSTTEPPYLAPKPMPGEIYGEYVGLAAWNGRPFPVWTDCRDDGVENVYFGKFETFAVEEQPATMPVGLEVASVSGGLNVSFAPPAAGNYRFGLYDAQGRRFSSESRYIDGSQGFFMKAEDLPQGAYFLLVEGDGFRGSQKLVRTR